MMLPTAKTYVTALLSASLLCACSQRAEPAADSTGRTVAPPISPSVNTPSAVTPAPVPGAPSAGTNPPTTTGTVSSVAALPDFTALVKREGPAVVHVATVRAARGLPEQATAGTPEDPMQEFFRRFMPRVPVRKTD